MGLIALVSGTEVEARYCKRCRVLLQPKIFPGGHKEAPSMYAKRMFCSQGCFGAQFSADRPLADRFWLKVEKTDGCWLWRGVVGRDGYGHFHFTRERHNVGAHRVSWFLEYGWWAKEDVLHKCNVRICVRPEHLYEGDDFDNCADKRKAGTIWHPPRGGANARAVLTDEQAYRIRLALSTGKTGVALAKIYGVGTSTISRIRLGQRYP